MPRLNPPPVGDRFFARVLSARLECPRCGFLDQFGPASRSRGDRGNPERRRKGRTPLGWNPVTGRWQCPSCRMTFVLGILAWPVASGGSAGPATLPRDQVPSYRQLAQLRAQGGGLWMRGALKGFRATGANIAAGCTCKPGAHYTDAADPACPLRDDQPG